MRTNSRNNGSIFPLMFANLDSWLRSPRTIIMFLFSLGTTFILVERYGNTIQFYNHTMNYTESLAIFSMSGFNGLSMASITYLIMVSETPRQIAFQQYCVLRSTRTKWAISQICYCIITAIFMIVFLLFFASLFMLRYVTPGDGWSDTIRIAEGMDPTMAYVPEWIRVNYSPIQALLLSLAPIFLFWFTMVLVILLCSILGQPTLGIALYAVILFASLIFPFELFSQFEPPTTYATLIRIGYNHEEDYSLRLQHVFVGYSILVSCLITGILRASKHAEIQTYSMNKH